MQRRFVALTLIWGANFVFIKLGVQAVVPLQVAFGRVSFGALTLLVIAVTRRHRMPREPRIWAHLAVNALVANVLPFALYAYAEQRVTSALTSIGNATIPLFTLLFALLFLPDERPTWRRSVGLGLGFFGVLMVLGVWRGITHVPDVLGMLLVLTGAASYGLSTVYMRRYLTVTGYSSLALTLAQLALASLALALILPFATSLPDQIPGRALLAIFALGAVGTGIGYLLCYDLVRIAGATIASTVTYFIPIVAIAIGVLGLGERLAWTAPLGAPVIVAGAILTRKPARASTHNG